MPETNHSIYINRAINFKQIVAVDIIGCAGVIMLYVIWLSKGRIAFSFGWYSGHINSNIPNKIT